MRRSPKHGLFVSYWLRTRSARADRFSDEVYGNDFRRDKNFSTSQSRYDSLLRMTEPKNSIPTQNKNFQSCSQPLPKSMWFPQRSPHSYCKTIVPIVYLKRSLHLLSESVEDNCSTLNTSCRSKVFKFLNLGRISALGCGFQTGAIALRLMYGSLYRLAG